MRCNVIKIGHWLKKSTSGKDVRDDSTVVFSDKQSFLSDNFS
jgi:hypothetical protein